MKKSKNKHLYQKTYRISRIISCVAFAVLVAIGISSLVFAMQLDDVAAEDGIPTAWEVANIKYPNTITVPITYWDQRVDACDDENRQFEWGKCHYWTKGALQGIVQPRLGADHLPIPTFASSDAAWEANHDIFTANVTGSSPAVQPSDNFYRWFHDVEGLSQKITGKTITFTREGTGATYTYGGQNIYPLDQISGFDEGDVKLRGADGKMHNFHFTGHLRIPMRIIANGLEKFSFSGDDDVWVFLNDQLVLDIGGLHEALSGWFIINSDGTLKTHINSVSNVADRTEELTSCMKEIRAANSACNNNFNNWLVQHNQPDEQTINIGIKSGDIVYLDFFYAERSSDGSNTKITIENMDWPISADVALAGEIVEELENSNIAAYQTSLTNRDPDHTLQLERIASYIHDAAGENTNDGFIPLSSENLYYTTTPEDESSWQPLELSAPADNAQGFNLDIPLTLATYGSLNDTVYFRYFTETLDTNGEIENVISYYTSINNTKRIVHTDTKLTYERKTTPPVEPDPIDPEPDNPDPVKPDEPDPVAPVNPEPERPTTPIDPATPAQPETPTESATPTLPILPAIDITDDGLMFIAPLGEVAYVPNTGIVSSNAKPMVADFAAVVLSQGFVMTALLVFAIAFALMFSLRKYDKKATHVNAAKTSTQPAPTKTTKARSAKTVKATKTTKATKTGKTKPATKTSTKKVSTSTKKVAHRAPRKK